MNTDTGAIARFETTADAKAAGHDLLLTMRQAAGLLAMPRPERVHLVRGIRKRNRKRVERRNRVKASRRKNWGR